MEYIVDISSKKTGLDVKQNNKIKGIIKDSIYKIIRSLAEYDCDVASSIVNKQVVLEIMLVDDVEIQKINKKYRNIDKPTNVLSFQSMGVEDIKQYRSPIIDIGSIIISIPTCNKEAKEYDTNFDTYILKILIHGLLHLLGYDHQSEEEASNMLNKEQKVIADLGIKTLGLTNNYWD